MSNRAATSRGARHAHATAHAAAAVAGARLHQLFVFTPTVLEPDLYLKKEKKHVITCTYNTIGKQTLENIIYLFCPTPFLCMLFFSATNVTFLRFITYIYCQ